MIRDGINFYLMDLLLREHHIKLLDQNIWSGEGSY